MEPGTVGQFSTEQVSARLAAPHCAAVVSTIPKSVKWTGNVFPPERLQPSLTALSRWGISYRLLGCDGPVVGRKACTIGAFGAHRRG